MARTRPCALARQRLKTRRLRRRAEAAESLAAVTAASVAVTSMYVLAQLPRRGRPSWALAQALAPLTWALRGREVTVKQWAHESMGAEVRGVDLREPVPPAVARRLRTLLGEYGVLLFRGQELSARDALNGAAIFGTPVNPKGMEQPINHFLHQGEHVEPRAEDFWHSDNSYMDVPGGPTMLYALNVPLTADGTPLSTTLFSDAEAAARDLPQPLRGRIGKLSAVHKAWTSVSDQPPEAIHPVLRRNPLTGREALFVGPSYVQQFAEWTPKGSEALLKELFDFAFRPPYTYSHSWQQGDFLVWDNGRVAHRSTLLDLPSGLERDLWRVQTRGPGRVPGTPQGDYSG